jgi:hypothetical protein
MRPATAACFSANLACSSARFAWADAIRSWLSARSRCGAKSLSMASRVAASRTTYSLPSRANQNSRSFPLRWASARRRSLRDPSIIV